MGFSLFLRRFITENHFLHANVLLTALGIDKVFNIL